MQVFITVVNFPNQDGVTPTVLGTFRTGEATLFSWDVAVQKARTALAYSNNGNTMALSTRTVGFLAQSHYPPGIDANHAGPFFGQQEMFSGLVGTLSNVSLNMNFVLDLNLPNGITIFPGGFPLYRNGQLIGAIGVSGDGVDQDDIVGDLAHGVDEQPVLTALQPQRRHQRQDRFGLLDAPDEREHQNDIGEAHLAANPSHGLALQDEPLSVRGVGVAGCPPEADHRIVLCRLEVRSAQQAGVLVGLEVGHANTTGFGQKAAAMVPIPSDNRSTK